MRISEKSTDLDGRQPGTSAVAATAGASDPAAPLVVLLHGRGSSESEIIALADHRSQRAVAMPGLPTVASAVRLPSR
jgi:phospholipase/carboxylesterase